MNKRIPPNRAKSPEEIYSIAHHASHPLTESFSLLQELKKKYGLEYEHIVELLLDQHKYQGIPIEIFRSSLPPLESLVRHLKDQALLSFAHIAKLLQRDETTIWMTYHNSLKRGMVTGTHLDALSLKEMNIKRENLIVPLSIFSQRRLSVLESLSLYLQETLNLSYHDLSVLLERNERTIWTVIYRAKEKLHGQKP